MSERCVDLQDLKYNCNIKIGNIVIIRWIKKYCKPTNIEVAMMKNFEITIQSFYIYSYIIYKF